jgi:dihydrolipoamide dehydrogenase
MGKYQARIAGDVIAARAAGRPLDGIRYTDVADSGAVPQVTFTDPEVGSVGLTTEQARGAGVDVETVEYDLAGVAGSALLRDDYVGRANLVLDRATDTLVGATFVGSGIAELVHSATVAVVGKVPVSVLWHAVPSYPTVSEIWLRLLETLRGQRGTARDGG